MDEIVVALQLSIYQGLFDILIRNIKYKVVYISINRFSLLLQVTIVLNRQHESAFTKQRVNNGLKIEESLLVFLGKCSLSYMIKKLTKQIYEAFKKKKKNL